MRYASDIASVAVRVEIGPEGGLDCLGCTEPGHHSRTCDEMISHLRVHQAYGDHVPMSLIHRLEDCRTVVDGVAGPHSPRDAPCALCDPEDDAHPAHTPTSVRGARIPD